MKSPFNQAMRSRILANIVVIIVGIIFAFIMLRFDGIINFFTGLLGVLTPLIIGLVIAMVILPVVNRVEFWLKPMVRRKKPLRRLRRAISLAVAYLLLIAVISAFFSIVLPLIITSIAELVNNGPDYVRSLINRMNDLADEYNLESDYIQNIFGSWEQFLLRSVEYLATQLPVITTLAVTLSNGVANFLIGCAISFYMLNGKERFAGQTKKIFSSFMPPGRVELLNYWARRTNDIFSQYITGSLLHSLVEGILCFIFMGIFRMEYPVLISVIVGVTNIAPIIGPIAGGAVGVIVLLFANPINALWFLILMIFLQQVDSSIIGPMIVGDSIGLSSFWVILAIVLGGGFFGIPGILLSVPFFALLYAIIKSSVEARLSRLNLPTETSEYILSEPLTRTRILAKPRYMVWMAKIFKVREKNAR
jgi:predicted PurR-regulated permease PerM